jgi:CopG family transcriptional regulator / antitoxin EndoAI
MPRAASNHKSTRVLISIPDEFLTEIDSIAGEEHRSRSDLIREALRLYMRNMKVFDQEALLQDDMLIGGAE